VEGIRIIRRDKLRPRILRTKEKVKKLIPKGGDTA